ncbi:hypothetical protein PybrP1_005516, partial [[Pythium] brassicae (nom. inval.)]
PHLSGGAEQQSTRPPRQSAIGNHLPKLHISSSSSTQHPRRRHQHTHTAAAVAAVISHDVRNRRDLRVHDEGDGAAPGGARSWQENPAPRAGLERHSRVRRQGHCDRARAPGDHRPRVRRAAAREQRPGGVNHARCERRDLQLPRACGRARDAVRVPHQVGLRGHHPALPRARRGLCAQAARHVLVRTLRREEGLFHGLARPHGHHAAILRLRRGRQRLVRVRDEGARARLRALRGLPARQHVHERHGDVLAVVQPVVVRAGAHRLGPARPEGAARGVRERGEAPDDVGRALGRAALGRARLIARRVHRGAREEEARGGRRRVDQPHPLVHDRARELAGPDRGQGGGRISRHDPPLVHVHDPGRARRRLGGDQAPRDVRRDDRARVDAHVPHVAQDQGDGHQDGALGRGRGRGLWRLPLLPQGAERDGVPPRDGRQAPRTLPVRLPAREQVDERVGARGARAVPGRRLPRHRHEHRLEGEDDRHEAGQDGEVHHPQGLRRRRAAVPANAHPLAPEGAVLGRRRLWLDRLAQGLGRARGDRAPDEARGAALPVQHAADKGGKHFEKEVAAQTVPGGPSIACSTSAAIEWDEAFKNSADPSGRAIAGVHVDAYGGHERGMSKAASDSLLFLPAIHGAASTGNHSMLPRLGANARVATPPSPPTTHKQDLSRLPAPRQRLQPPSAGSASLLKFPSLVKPQHRIPPLVVDAKCNQDEESDSFGGDRAARQIAGNNNVAIDGHADDDDDDNSATQPTSSRRLPASVVASATRPVGDKNRDFIRELEEKKKKQRADEARKERRRHKLHEKMTRKILEEAAQARQKQPVPEESDPAESSPRANVSEQASAPEARDRDSDEEARRRKEKAKHQKRLLKKQQALLEQIQTRKKEKEEDAELERERERRKQEKVKRAVLTAIYDANARLRDDDDDGQEAEGHGSADGREDPSLSGGRLSEDGKKEPVAAGPTLAAAVAVGSAIAALRDRRDALAAAVAQQQQQQPEELQDESKQRTKELREALTRKQHEYLQRLAEQRKLKQKEDEDVRALHEKRKRKLQQEALLRHQEVAKQQQEAAAAQREKEESAEKATNAPAAVDVDAMVARLSRLKERDSQVIPEARDFASWKKRHGVRADQSVFCVTGCYPVIRDELEKRGWFFNPDKASPFFDLKWSLKSDDLKAFKLEKHQYVNHFFQNTAITTKVGLLHNLRNLVWHQSLDIDTIFPRAYDLNEPRDMEAFVQDFRYGVAEGLLKELAKGCVQRKTTAITVNLGVVDVLLSVARKKVKSKRPGVGEDPAQSSASFDSLEESIDSLVAPGDEELVTDLEWEALTKCPADKPGKLRASLGYRRKVYAEDKPESSVCIDGGTGNGAGGNAQPSSPSVDTVLSALEKKQQRQLEKQRAEAFNREKARLAQRVALVAAIDESTATEAVRLLRALEKLCPQFRINGGWGGESPANGSASQGDGGEQLTAAVPTKSLNIWIVKPAGMSRGRGIRVFNNLELLLEYADVENHKECQWVAQKYIENPLLVCKRKFDIRQWVLVTSWDPLTVWFNQDCYLRFSSEEYTLEDLSDQYVHLTNNSIQKYSDKFHDVYATEDGGIAVEGNMLHSDAFKQYLRSELRKPEGFWEGEIQRRMKDIVVGSLQCVQDMVQHRANCCELFGYDFMIDTELMPWLIEVNSSPACDYSTPTAERYVKEGLAGIVKVIVDHRAFEQKKRSGGAGQLSEPDTGRWQRIHRAEYIGKPVASFGADFVVKGAKVARGRRGGRAAAGSGAVVGTTKAEPCEQGGDSVGEVAEGGDEEHGVQEERDASTRSHVAVVADEDDGSDQCDADEGHQQQQEDESVDSLL